MNKVTVIVPIHEYNEEIAKHFEYALNSVNRQEQYNEIIDVLVVAPPDVIAASLFDVNKFTNLSVNYVANEGETDFQSQVNLGVKSLNKNTKYFTVLEFDDELSNKYFKNVEKYIKAMPDVDIFLAMMVEVISNGDVNTINKWTNENVWSHQFVNETGEVGYLNMQSLKEYSDFKLSGAVIKVDEYNNIGGYKKNIKMTFGYELLLRALNNSLKVYTIPKIIYKHLVSREGSLFNVYQKDLSMGERKFWFDTANKEFHYINDREIDLTNLKK